jgi:hypothetical protein
LLSDFSFDDADFESFLFVDLLFGFAFGFDFCALVFFFCFSHGLWVDFLAICC